MNIMIDDLLLQENCSLKEQLKIATKIVKYYVPEMDERLFLKNLSTEDYLLYLEENKNLREALKEIIDIGLCNLPDIRCDEEMFKRAVKGMNS